LKKKLVPIRVIIFEDLELIREYLQQIISACKDFYFVAAFADARDVVKAIEATQPDVVLMDIQMPGISGIQALRIIKQKFPDVQVLMQTVLDNEDKIFDAICAGASGYLLKNTEDEKIIASIREVYEGGAPFSPSIARKILGLIKPFSGEPMIDFDLSKRELEILNCIVSGMSYKMIAAHCFISIDTVKTHIRKIYEKLHVNSKSEAVIKALKNKIV
jgi:DNA-binding NarL/FixJ family response regulator